MDDQKRLLTAVVLTVVILGLYSFVFKPQQPAEKVSPAQEALQQEQTAPAEPVIPEKDQPLAEPVEIEASKPAETIVETPLMAITFSSEGGAIKKLALKSHQAEDGNGNYVLLESGSPGSLSVEAINNQPLQKNTYNLMDKSDTGLVYALKLSGGLEIIKTYTFSNDNYDIGLSIVLKNSSGSDKAISYRLIAASGINKGSTLDKRFLNLGVYRDGELDWKSQKDVKKKAEAGKLYKDAGGADWAMIRNTHFAAIISPYEAISYVYFNWLPEQEHWLVGLGQASRIIPARGSQVDEYLLYAGPTQKDFLEPLGLGEAVNFGKLNGICQVLLRVLKFFYGLVGSYGLAIVMLVLLINLVLYPLTYKNVRSMRQMQAVQPHLARLRDIHKDDQKKLQAEMMKFYRENRINPVGGCLPMLLQIPIFFSLYIMLARSTELKGSSFLWIKDLSLPDAVAKLPFTIPLVSINTLNILPLIMVVAMFMQQKISMGARAGADSQQAQQQKMMMVVMPVMFGFILYNLPSGLVLYWTTNTIMMALMHFIIQRRLSDEDLIKVSEE